MKKSELVEVKTNSDILKIHVGDWVRFQIKGDLLPYVVAAVDRGAVGFLGIYGRTNHGVIAAKELGIPFILDVKVKAIKKVRKKLIIDVKKKQSLVKTRARVFVNMGFPKRIIARNPQLPDFADGVGFARIEFAILEIIKGIHPINFMARYGAEKFSDLIFEHFSEAVKIFAGKNFWVRTDDFSSNQLSKLQGGLRYETTSFNEIVGFRGIARAIDPQWQDLGNFEKKLSGIAWIEPQFRALARLAREFPETKLGIFPPMVHDISEYKIWQKMARKIIKSKVGFGLMVEIPSVAGQGIQVFLDEGLIDFMIFGSNDLTALTLGIDRSNHYLQHLFNEEHPMVFSLMEETIVRCRRARVITAIGGEAASRASLIEKLHKAGLDVFSVTPNLDTVHQCRKVIYKTERKNR